MLSLIIWITDTPIVNLFFNFITIRPFIYNIIMHDMCLSYNIIL